MKLPDNWNSIPSKEYGDFKALKPGAYMCRIVKAQEKISRSGKHMLVIDYDISEGEYKDYYRRIYDSKTGFDKKWPGAYYQLTEGFSEQYFKGVITAIEKSNGFIFTGNELELRDKIFGGIFGEEDYIKQDGSIGAITKLFYITSVDRIKNGSIEIPKKKELKLQEKQTDYYSHGNPSIADEELPF